MEALTTTARPYAQAAFRYAEEHNEIENWSAMLGLLASVISDTQMQSLIANPHLEPDTYVSVVKEVCGDGLSASGQQFVQLLADRRRINNLPAIYEQFEVLRRDSEGSVDVHVTSAYALNPKFAKTIEASVKDRLGKEVVLTSEIDRKLIAGVLIQVGDTVIDASAKGRLDRLRSALA